jgi:hypothetical protein
MFFLSQKICSKKFVTSLLQVARLKNTSYDSEANVLTLDIPSLYFLFAMMSRHYLPTEILLSSTKLNPHLLAEGSLFPLKKGHATSTKE